MIKKDKKAFFICIAKGDNRSHRHLSYGSAVAEAERLQKLTGKQIWVAKTIRKAVKGNPEQLGGVND